MSTFVKTVPLLVEDAALAQTTTVDLNSGEPALRVTSAAVGDKTDPDTEPTVIGLLKRIVSNLS